MCIRDRARRARTIYDWVQIIPQMQVLWSEQDAMRRASAAQARRYAATSLPVAPSPTALFGGYPTEQAGFASARFLAVDLTGRASLAEVLAVRNYQGLKRMFAAPDHIAAVLAAVRTGAEGLSALETATGLRAPNLERVLIWLLKYDFIRRV